MSIWVIVSGLSFTASFVIGQFAHAAVTRDRPTQWTVSVLGMVLANSLAVYAINASIGG